MTINVRRIYCCGAYFLGVFMEQNLKLNNLINDKIELIEKIKLSLTVDKHLDCGQFETVFSELEKDLPLGILETLRIDRSAFSERIASLKNALNDNNPKNKDRAKKNLVSFLSEIQSVLNDKCTYEKFKDCYGDGGEPDLNV